MEDFALYGLTDTKTFFQNLTYEPTIPTITKKEKLNGRKLKVEYINLPASFDIETSSFRENGEKKACMYIWQLGINGRVIIGRTWEEFIDTINQLVDIFKLNAEKRLVIYVHNLAYEFAWIKHRFQWSTVFSREKGSPMKALTTNGIEFRCSYILSGCNLDMTCKNLTKYKMNKKTGDLDYSLIRTPITPITDQKELDYCVYDVLGVMAYIQEQIEQYGDITKIPLTNTGRVRLYCRQKCFSKENKQNYSYLMSSLKLTGLKEYEMLKRAFSAGFTHANFMTANETFTDVASKDLTSSYPTILVCEKFPMSKGQWVKVHHIDQIKNMEKDYYCIFNIRFHNLREKENIPDHYISFSKCYGCEDYRIDNGRVISAKKLETTITSDDWKIIDRCYDYDSIDLGKCIRYRLNYLPRVFVQCVIDFYNKKSTLKGVPNMESDLQLYKGMLNATFGMCVTDVVSDEICYEDEWLTKETNRDDCIEEYNKSRNRFLFYPWGIKTCSAARLRLWSAILELGQDYLYSDTDSVYYLNEEKHREYFERANIEITEKIKRACHFNKLNFEETQPKNNKGIVQPLGVWDDNVKGIEPTYRRFKTLGAKRYMYEYMDKDGLHIATTIAGASKSKAGEYIRSQEEPFEFFTDKMSIDSEHSGRLIHSHINEKYTYTVTDYLGNIYTGEELSGIHMEPSEYNLTISPIFLDLLNHKETRGL